MTSGEDLSYVPGFIDQVGRLLRRRGWIWVKFADGGSGSLDLRAALYKVYKPVLKRRARINGSDERVTDDDVLNLPISKLILEVAHRRLGIEYEDIDDLNGDDRMDLDTLFAILADVREHALRITNRVGPSGTYAAAA